MNKPKNLLYSLKQFLQEMKTYIALLRGINVSGQKIIKMDRLRESLKQLDFAKTQTYIQSGNIIFSCEKTDHLILETKISKLILENWDFEVPVIVRELGELIKIKNGNPFLKDVGIDTSKLHVSFLSNTPKKESINGLSNFKSPSEQFIIIEKEMYFYFPNGVGKSKLTNKLLERKLSVTCTSRNWRTVNKLIEIGENS